MQGAMARPCTSTIMLLLCRHAKTYRQFAEKARKMTTVSRLRLPNRRHLTTSWQLDRAAAQQDSRLKHGLSASQHWLPWDSTRHSHGLASAPICRERALGGCRAMQGAMARPCTSTIMLLLCRHARTCRQFAGTVPIQLPKEQGTAQMTGLQPKGKLQIQMTPSAFCRMAGVCKLRHRTLYRQVHYLFIVTSDFVVAGRKLSLQSKGTSRQHFYFLRMCFRIESFSLACCILALPRVGAATSLFI